MYALKTISLGSRNILRAVMVPMKTNKLSKAKRRSRKMEDTKVKKGDCHNNQGNSLGRYDHHDCYEY
jgi:hypothetical protein